MQIEVADRRIDVQHRCGDGIFDDGADGRQQCGGRPIGVLDPNRHGIFSIRPADAGAGIEFE